MIEIFALKFVMKMMFSLAFNVLYICVYVYCDGSNCHNFLLNIIHVYCYINDMCY